MAKNDNRIKCAQVRKLVEERQYKKAVMLLDTMDFEKAKPTVTDYYAFAQAGIKTGRLDMAEKMLLHIYQGYASRKVIYQLIRLMLKGGRMEEAEKYYEEYAGKYPDYVEGYLLRYRIDKAKKADYRTRIASLEQLKKADYMEEWAYELAKLYHKAGMKEKCIAECSDIILWFGNGVIVEKARLLKAYYTNGTEDRTPDGFFSEGKSALSGDETDKAGSGEDQEKQKEENEPSGQLYMNTQDLSREVALLKHQEETDKLKKELLEDLEPTINIQEAIKRELESEKSIRTERPVYRLLREEKKEEELLPAEEPEELEKPDELLRGAGMDEIFGDIWLEKPVQAQTEKVLKAIAGKGECGRFLLIGEDPQRNLSYAKNLAKALFQMGRTKTTRVAKVQGNRLNGMDLREQQEKLAGGVLYVECPGQMYTPTVKSLIGQMEEWKDKIIIVFAAGAEETELLLEENYNLRKYMTHRIWL